MDHHANTLGMPPWFRRVLIAITAILMCSCRASGQECLTCPTGEACPQGTCLEGCPVCAPEHHYGPGDEYLCDGGDRGYSAGLLKNGDYVGLEQEDTVAVYTGCEGRVVVQPSSRVCIYAPRFASVRRVVYPMGAVQRTFVDAVGDRFGAAEADLALPATTSLQQVALRGQVLPLPTGLYRGRQQAGATERLLAAMETRGLVGPYLNLQLIHFGVIEMAEAPLVAKRSLAAIAWTGDQELQVTVSGQGASAVFSPKQPGLLYQTDAGCPRLRVVKCASDQAAHPGEEVEFTIRFDNVGDAPLADLEIVDNLTTRLEYVADSAHSSRDAHFETARNDAGSLVLRWRFEEPLPAGEGGLLTFKCRVR